MFFVVAKLQMVFACRLNRISTHYIIHWYQDTWWSVMWWLPSYRLMSVFVSFANVLCEFYWINWDQRFHTFSSCFTTRHPLSTTWCILYITWGDIYIYIYVHIWVFFFLHVFVGIICLMRGTIYRAPFDLNSTDNPVLCREGIPIP